jgi:hypothetical protein
MTIPDVFDEFGRHVIFMTVIDHFKRLIETFGGTKATGKDIYSDIRVVTAFFRHRNVVYEKLYEQAFETATNVTYVSIMSRGTLDAMTLHLNRAKDRGTKIRVLTWDPAVGPKVVEAFRKHLGEYEDDPPGAYRQVQSASTRWQTLATEFPTVITGIRQYDSVPTMQGLIVKDQWALIELLPFHKSVRERPALYLSASLDAEMFSLFDTAFDSLYNCSKPLISSTGAG